MRLFYINCWIDTHTFCLEKYTSWLAKNSLSPTLLGSVYNVHNSQLRKSSASPPPPAEPAVNESYLSGTSGAYVEEMYEAWAFDPKSVHASWDAYFRGGAYQAPPSLGASTNPNEVPLASVLPNLAAVGRGSGVAASVPHASSAVIDAHLAVQGTIR